MTYHLPRIEQWLQNKSLEFYPVWQLRQVEINPSRREINPRSS